MLKIEKFKKAYVKDVYVIKNMDLELKPGEVLAFVGVNGAGKTTTLKSIVGILDITEGDIKIDGLSIKTNKKECQKKMAYVPDNPDVYDHLKARAYLEFIGNVYKVDKKVRRQKYEAIAKKLGISDRLDEVIANYSHGMKQKLALTAAFMHEPQLLILDEPFVGLDPIARKNLKDLMHERTIAGGAIIFSTHVLAVAEKLCDKVVILKNGEIIIEGAMKEVIKKKNLEELFMELV